MDAFAILNDSRIETSRKYRGIFNLCTVRFMCLDNQVVVSLFKECQVPLLKADLAYLVSVGRKKANLQVLK
jgi:hypothetical protein